MRYADWFVTYGWLHSVESTLKVGSLEHNDKAASTDCIWSGILFMDLPRRIGGDMESI